MALMQFKRISPVAVEPPAPPVKDAVTPPPPSTRWKLNETILYADSTDGIQGHYKVWHIECVGTTVTTRWGKVGASLQYNTKTYTTEWEAQETVKKMIGAKRAKGYRDNM